MRITSLVLGASLSLIVLTGCGGSSDDPQPVEQTTTDSSSQSPTLSAGGGQQAPDSPVTRSPDPEMTKEDQARVRDAAKEVVKLYGAGGDHDQWFKNISPMLTPSMQKQVESFDPSYSKLNVSGEPHPLVDPRYPDDNPYWVTMSVPTTSGNWAVIMTRDADRPEVWKADQILPVQVWEKESAE